MKLANMEHLELLVVERTSDLSEILSEKELLLKEIHHRVKNNMQLITSLLTIQAKTIDDESIKAMFRMCQGRIQTMALIHESLYKSDNLKSISIHEYMSALTTNLSHFQQGSDFQPASIKLSVDPIVLDIDIAIVCGLIVNELVTNSLKHAFSRKQPDPTITVSLTATTDTYSLRVSDNGTGIKDLTALESPTTMGFSIISVLATHQLEGRIVLDNESGTSIEIIFPRDE
jgi:two-component sensor histidine kinase